MQKSYHNQSATKTVKLLLLTLLLFISVATSAAASDQRKASEYGLKAAFIFNFSRFVSWPNQAFKAKDAPLVIGIMGDNPFSANFKKILSQENSGARPVLYRENVSLSNAHLCHILYISPSEKLRLPAIIKQLRGYPILTVGDYPQFCQSGGIINLEKKNHKLKLSINNQSAIAANLKISSKLLRIADLLESKP